MKELLEAGVHFGHQTRRWNPKMKSYIFGARNGIYIIDLQKTVRMFRKVYDFVVDTVANGKPLLFVGTKKQARDSIYEEANRCEMFYIHNRWLGGMLTNFQTIRKSIDRLNYLNTIVNDESINLFPKKERLKLGKERIKLDNNLGGIRTIFRVQFLLLIPRMRPLPFVREDGWEYRLSPLWIQIVIRMRSIISYLGMMTPFEPFG